MKPIYIILLVVVLLGLGGGVAFFVTKKKKESKKSKPQTPTIQQKKNEPVLNKKTVVGSPIVNKPPKKEAIEFDITVPHVDIQNRRFDYSMHYRGIRYKGVFEDGVTRGVHIKKSFGAFVVKQRMNQERGVFDDPIATKAKQQKMRGGVTTKGGAVKVGTTGKRGLALPVVNRSEWVDLFILDNNNKILKQLSVNLNTGTTTPNAKIPE